MFFGNISYILSTRAQLRGDTKIDETEHCAYLRYTLATLCLGKLADTFCTECTFCNIHSFMVRLRFTISQPHVENFFSVLDSSNFAHFRYLVQLERVSPKAVVSCRGYFVSVLSMRTCIQPKPNNWAKTSFSVIFHDIALKSMEFFSCL